MCFFYKNYKYGHPLISFSFYLKQIPDIFPRRFLYVESKCQYVSRIGHWNAFRYRAASIATNNAFNWGNNKFFNDASSLAST